MLPYCPRCGQEVSDEPKFCPRCGSQIEYVSTTVWEPLREGVSEHLKFALELSKQNPVIFIPNVISAVLSFILMRIMDYWLDKYNFIERIYEWLGIDTNIIPIVYRAPGEALTWETAMGIVFLIVFLSSILDGILSISGLHISSEIVKGNETSLKNSLSYAISRFIRFFLAGLAILIFFGSFFGIVAFLAVVMEAQSLEIGVIALLVVSLAIVVVSILGSPFAVIMVADDIGFSEAISKAFTFSRKRIWTYLGLLILIGVVVSVLSVVPYVGWIIITIPSVVGNLAIIDLYLEYKKDSEL